MDRFVENKLRKWNLSCLIKTFRDESINTTTFRKLDYHKIVALIPRQDLRSHFLKKFEVLYNIPCKKTGKANTTIMDEKELIIDPINDEEMTDEPEESYLQPKFQLQSPSFDIDFVLSDIPGGKNILEFYNRTRQLDYGRRLSLANILIDFLITNIDEYTIENAVMDEIADAIITRFPNEKKDIYFKDCHNPRGLLIDCYYSVRNKLINEDNLKNNTTNSSADEKIDRTQSGPARSRQTPKNKMVNITLFSPNNKLVKSLPHMLADEKFVDITLECEGKSIKCHKMVLSSYSTYFDKILESNPSKHPVICLTDHKFWEVQALITFMYEGELNVEESKLPPLLELATKLNVKGLMNIDIKENEEDSIVIEDDDVQDCPPSATPSNFSKRKNYNFSLYAGGHYLQRLPSNRTNRRCSVCHKGSTFMCYGCDVAVHKFCFPIMQHYPSCA